MILIMYTKKIYTRFYKVWMVDYFFLPNTSCILTFTFQVYGANKKNIRTMFPSAGNTEMSVEFEDKKNTWLKVFLHRNPSKTRGGLSHTGANKILTSCLENLNKPPPPKHTKKCFILGSWQAQVLPLFRPQRQI